MLYANGIIGSQLNKYLTSGLGTVGEYNSNNTWNFNGNNRVLNNNNRYNSNFRSRPCSDYITNGKPVSQYTVPLELIQTIEENCKSNKPNCVKFRVNKIHNIIQVWHQINNETVAITEAMVFNVKLPKPREIIYCSYSDKLIQSYYVFSLTCFLEANWFDKDSYSCRHNKGVLKAIEAYCGYIKEAMGKYNHNDIFLASVDIKRFFLSIDCKLLAEKMAVYIETQLNAHPNKDKLLYLTRCLYIIDWHKVNIRRVDAGEKFDIPEEKTLLYSDPYIGVPIGNWPSQIGGNFITTFALVFLRGLGYNSFIHYTDDTSFVITNKAKFLQDIKIIEKFYREVLHLELHKKKRYMQHLSKGITTLGRRIKFTRCIASKRTINSIDSLIHGACYGQSKNKKYMERNCEHFLQSLNSYLGMLIHMNMYKYRKKILEIIENNFGDYYIIDKKDYAKINIKKRFSTTQKYIYYIKQKKKNEKIR